MLASDLKMQRLDVLARLAGEGSIRVLDIDGGKISYQPVEGLVFKVVTSELRRLPNDLLSVFFAQEV